MPARASLNNPECRQALAGEYVLGTLHGAARRRFERLLADSPDLQHYVAEWEEDLAPLAGEVAPAALPEGVWQRLEAAAAPEGGGWWESVAFWRPFGMAAAALLVAVGLFLGLSPRQGPPGDYVFVVPGEAGQVRWVVTASAEAGRLNIRPVEPPGVGPDRLCRLWWDPEGGEPRALAVLPEDGESIQVRLPPEARERLWRDEMAVTIDPADRPTVGKEVFRGRWAPMT